MTRKEILEHIQLRASGMGQAKDYSYKDFFKEMVEMTRKEVEKDNHTPYCQMEGWGNRCKDICAKCKEKQ